MTKRSISILITLMSIALIGIIVIQYLWIMKTLAEKQKLVDNNVQLAVSNVEEQLKDYRAMAFIRTDSMFSELPFENLSEIDSLLIDNWRDSNTNVEIQVLQNFETTNRIDTLREYSTSEDVDQFIEINESNYTSEDEINEVTALIHKVKIEIQGYRQDLRLDSLRFKRLLTKEIENNDIGKITDWAIYDSESNSYQIHPTNNEIRDYQIKLFTTDVLAPGRYELQLSLSKSDSVYADIWQMIALSLLFIAIISFVFAYSIKLVIRHKKISQIKSDFINNMTHEFKTPLASISLAADTLMHPNTEMNKENIRKYAEFIKHEKSKLNIHVERILEVAALKKDAIEIPISAIPISPIISKVLKDFELHFEKTKTELKLNLTEEIEILGNAFHLSNIISNILENAVKYSPNNPEINIISRIEQQEFILEIRDNGIGMNKEELNQAFDDFYRAETGNIHATKGFGIGLTYSKYMIEKMGGTIEISSEKDKGTRVFIKLKLA